MFVRYYQMSFCYTKCTTRRNVQKFLVVPFAFMLFHNPCIYYNRKSKFQIG